MKIERFRKYNTHDIYPEQIFDNDLCQVIRAGIRIYMRGQTILELDQKLHTEDEAEQANQAMQNVETLLEKAGSSLSISVGSRPIGRPLDGAHLSTTWSNGT